MEPRYLDLHDIAQLAGLEPDTARTYNKRARKNRAEGNPRPGDLPAPDTRIGLREHVAIPGWTEDTIIAWLATRPRKPIPVENS